MDRQQNYGGFEAGMTQGNQIICGDCLEVLPKLPRASVDLVFGSPPYEDARLYNMNFKLKGQTWVDWMVPIVKESLRVCKGLVAFVVEGRTRSFRWSATPALLMADLHRAGIHLRKPPMFHRIGIPGSGGPDWLRNDCEFIVCCTNGGRLPWSDNTAMGKACKYPVGGEMSNRTQDGRRRNAKTGIRLSRRKTPSETQRRNGEKGNAGYDPPTKANPGNIIKCNVGGGHLGSDLAHETEAPFPESLVEFFIRSFCPPDGIVLDPFSGSGTTVAVAEKLGRNWIAIDVRQGQCVLTRKRIDEAKREPKELFA
jgi:hypothetical protein